METAVKRLFLNAKAGNMAAFAKLLSWIEANGPRKTFGLSEFLKPKRAAFRWGVTGPPGAGKSTLVARLIHRLREEKLKVGVIAVDPSSPFSGGAILGDRIRYQEHGLDQKVFIRSLGTRGSLGGLSASAYLMLRAFDACDFDVVIIETVGVGQTELDVLHVADQVTVVLVPESGDSIQAMKAGLMEIADVFLVNKADRPGADSLVREIRNSIQDGESARKVDVFPVVALEGKGLEPWFDSVIKSVGSDLALKHRSEPKRLKEEARALLRLKWEEQLDKKLEKLKKPSQLKSFF